MKIKSINEEDFKKYGRVIKNYDLAEIIKVMDNIEVKEGVVYEPSIKELEALKIYEDIKNKEFGGLSIQIGYCNGHNHLLNAVEYHRTSEINIAVTNLILLLGLQQDITDEYTYDTSKIEAFLVPAGTMIECYATTLHFAPCSVFDNEFRCVVILPKGTNTELDIKFNDSNESKLLFAKNKWLIAHKDSGLEADGAFIGLVGDNISVKNNH